MVRPDGKISLPLLNDIQAAGLTPDQLREQLVKARLEVRRGRQRDGRRERNHSRNVYITGQVAKPSTYPLTGDMNVLQLIALAGGLLEYADSKNIVIMRQEHGTTQYYKFNYKDVDETEERQAEPRPQARGHGHRSVTFRVTRVKATTCIAIFS